MMKMFCQSSKNMNYSLVSIMNANLVFYFEIKKINIIYRNLL